MAAAALPRAPIYHVKSGEKDESDHFIRNILDWREAALQEATESQRMQIEFDNVARYIDLVEGKGFWGGDRPIYRSKFYDNRISKVRVETIAYLTDIRPSVDVTTTVDSFRNNADIIRKVIQHEWYARSMD